MKKIVINILIFLTLIFLFDYFIFLYESNKNPIWVRNYGYVFKNPKIYSDNINDYNNEIYFAQSKLKNKLPILLFGCSYTFGEFLNTNQKFGYKLSKILNTDVYNRAFSAGTYSFMLWQTQQDEFYKQVPPSKNVIYIFMFDHFRRSYIYCFNLVSISFYIRYLNKNNKLIQDKYENPFKNFIMSLYFVKMLNDKYIRNFAESNKNYEKVTDDAVLYFIKSRENLEKHWENKVGKINFTVIFYHTDFEPDYYDIYKNALMKKLKDKGFNVISTDELTNEDLRDPKYLMQTNWHPTEKAWDLLTPLIAERIKDNN